MVLENITTPYGVDLNHGIYHDSESAADTCRITQLRIANNRRIVVGLIHPRVNPWYSVCDRIDNLLTQIPVEREMINQQL